MTSVNMFEAKTELSKLVKMLENKEEDVIYIARNGVEVAQLTLIPPKNVEKRIGIAEGKIQIPNDFDELFDAADKEIEELFESSDEL